MTKMLSRSFITCIFNQMPNDENEFKYYSESVSENEIGVNDYQSSYISHLYIMFVILVFWLMQYSEV